MNALSLVFAVTFVASLVLTPLARWLALRSGAVDRPDGKRKLQKHPVPLWGGLAVYAAIGLGLFATRAFGVALPAGFYDLAWVVFATASFVCLLGCIDDSCDLNAKCKLLFQIVSVLPVVLAGWWFETMSVVDSFALFGHRVELGWLGIPLTVIWLVGCINALNLLDGMDGLASVVGLSTAAILAIIASTLGHAHVALVAVVLCGALAGFLVYNLPPARIYLGDSGSMVIGLVVGILSIQGALKTAATLSITAPAALMAIPLLDTALAILRRKLSGQRFDTPDRGHIHHRLLDRGLSPWQALCVIGSLSLATGAAAVAATVLRSDALAWVITLTLVVLLVRLRAFGDHEVSLAKDRAASVLARWAVRLAHPAQPPRRRKKQPLPPKFEEAWAALTEEAARDRSNRLELTVTVDGQPAGRHVWSSSTGGGGDADAWSLSLTFGDPTQDSCRLTAHGHGPVEPWLLLRLSNVLRGFGQHALAHADTVPHVLPLEHPPREDSLEVDPDDGSRYEAA